jgi:H+-translocating NAD(P) transhydrogenase subunit alpha
MAKSMQWIRFPPGAHVSESSMQAAVLREGAPGERRVALSPDGVAALIRDGVAVAVQSGAGTAAGFTDEAYATAGATIEPDAGALLARSDLLLAVNADAPASATLRRGAIVVGFLRPHANGALLEQLAGAGVTALSMELVPRSTRAQRMDALSSQATIAGYKAVLLAANTSPRLFPMLMTAAGTIAPARVLVIGAGVAGLQAIATARRLGAVVQGFDIRPAAREQVESLGATWVGIAMEEAVGQGGYAAEVSEEAKRREHEHLHDLVAGSDVVITTAQIPGRPAPRLITAAMVEAMRTGSIVVDLAAEAGGNCDLTRAGEPVEHGGVTILGPVNLPATLPFHASQTYSRNITALVQILIKDGQPALNFDDEIVRACAVTHDGRVLYES